MLNTGLEWVRVSGAVGGAADGRISVELLEDGPQLIAPGQLRFMGVRIADSKSGGAEARLPCPTAVSIGLLAERETSSGWEAVQPGQPILVELECRRALESFRFTFVDHDGSVSEAAAVAPWSAVGNPGPFTALSWAFTAFP